MKELVDAGFNTSELRLAQYTCVELYNYGFTLIQLRQGNYTAYELNHFLSVSGEQLYYLGYSISDLETIGYYLKSYDTTQRNNNIYKYCHTNSKINGTNIRITGCISALPLSKINKLNTSTNDTSLSKAMKYSQFVNSYGTVKSSTSYPKKTCRIGGPTFSY